MTKNMTRKGLAFGAGLSLIAAGFAGVPANAIGEDGNVRVDPDTGAEYVVRSTDYFDLKAAWSDSSEGTGNDFKYLVEATSGAFKFDLDSNPAATDEAYTVTNGVGIAAVAAGGITAGAISATHTVTYTVPAGHGLVTGDTIIVAGVTATTLGNDWNGIFIATVTGNAVAITNTSPDATGLGLTGGTIEKLASADGTSVTLYTTAAHKFQVGDVVTPTNFVTLTGNKTITAIDTNEITFADTTQTVIEDATNANTIVSVQADGLSTYAQIIARGLGSFNIVAGDDGTDTYPRTDTTLVTGTTNYVIDSNDAVNTGADHVLRLVATSTTATTEVKVTAWVDKNNNGLIDSDESKSPVRTVKFLKAADITATTTIRPATVADSTVTADVVFTPTLNGNMIIRNEGLTATTITSNIAKVNFTRQGDSTAVTGNTNGSYSNTTKTWSFPSVDFATSNGWTVTNGTKVTPGANGEATQAGKIFLQTAAVSATGVVTMTTGIYTSSAWTAAAHGLRVGDKIIITDEDGTKVWESASAVTITSVPTTSSFTFKITSTTAVAATTLGITTSTEAFWTVDTYLRDSVEAGAITAQFYFDSAGTGNVSTPNVAQTVAPKASISVGAQVVGASGIAVDGVASATVSAAGSIYKGTTTANAVVSVTDVLGDPVAAGVDVALTATKSSSGTVKLNGTTVTSSTVVYAKTNASGEIPLVIENSSALATNTLAITAASQGATATKTFTWEDKNYTLHDLADTTAANSSRARTVAPGASYTFNLLAQDQFKAPAGADVRLLVTTEDRTVSQNIVALTAAGTATVVVADGGLGAGTSTGVKIGFQKLTSGVWSTQSGTDSFQDWNNDAAEQDDLAKVVINYDVSVPTLTLNINGANFPGSGTADNAAAVAVAALKVIDLRNTAGVAGAYTSAQTGTVSGQVTNAFGVAMPGTFVTVSGANLLFNSGDVWTSSSVTLLTNATGQFSVNVFSSTFGAKVVTATVGSASKTFTVTYTGIAGDASLTVTTPAAVKPASTFQVKAKLADVFGNGVDTAAGRVKVTYTGAGIVFGTLPTETDANGELQFSVLLGSNDTGTISVTVSYDQNGDADYIDAKDLATTSTTEITASGVAAAAAKVNVGSFKGYVALYAKGYARARR